MAEFAEMGQYIGAGLACIAMGGAGIGVGHVAGNYLNGALRNPAAAKDQLGNFFVGMAFAEALGIFGLVVALLLLFVVGGDGGAAETASMLSTVAVG